jgi:hypothetical protein
MVCSICGPEMLRLEELAVGSEDDAILVKVFASGINSFDGVLRSGEYAKAVNRQVLRILNYDIAGPESKRWAAKLAIKLAETEPVGLFFAFPSTSLSGIS